MSSTTGPVIFEWRGAFTNTEVNRLHAEAFETRLFSDEEWNWRELTARHSLGWITARDDGQLVGFANVLWDGLVHAWIQDVMLNSRTSLLPRSASATKTPANLPQAPGCGVERGSGMRSNLLITAHENGAG